MNPALDVIAQLMIAIESDGACQVEQCILSCSECGIYFVITAPGGLKAFLVHMNEAHGRISALDASTRFLKQ